MSKIEFSEELGQYRFRFLNGEVVIPNRSGGYVVASGCGSGKTTAIRQLMINSFHEGILYSAATIKECNEMYDWLVDKCTKNNIQIRDTSGIIHTLTPDKILTIHSEPRIEEVNGKMICTNGVNTSLWMNHPDKVAEYYIVICTHHKLLNENPYVLMTANFHPMRISTNLIRMAMSGIEIGSSIMPPRQWVLIDELPTCSPLQYIINKNSLIVSGTMMDINVIKGFNQYGEAIYEEQRSVKVNNNFGLFQSKLLYASRGDRSLDFGDLKVPSVKLKFDLISSVIHENYYEYIRSESPEVKVTYNLSKIVIENGMRTKLILFDGTGDLTQVGSKRFTLLTYPNKYNSPINLYRFDNHIDRVVKIDVNFSSRVNILESLNKNIEELQNIIDSNERTLIVTWKNLKSEDYRFTREAKKTLINDKSLSEFVLNDDFSLVNYYKDRLVAKPGKEFDVIHYQSGLDRAVNDYREYDSIVFLGKFQVPGSVISEFNELYGCDTDLRKYTLYQLTQAICRTRIRKHEGKPINLYFSSDWSNEVIKDELEYLTVNKVKGTVFINDGLKNIKPKWRPVVEKLCMIDEGFNEAIDKGLSYKLSFTLDEIWDLTREVLPMSRKQVEKYYPLINYLRKFGIEIEIKGGAKNQYTKLA